MAYSPSPERDDQVRRIGASVKINGLIQALGQARARFGNDASEHLNRVNAQARKTRDDIASLRASSAHLPTKNELSPLNASMQTFADDVESAIQQGPALPAEFDALLTKIEQALMALRAAYHLDT